MDKNTFGNAENIKSLGYIVDYVEKMDEKRRRRISNFVHNVNSFTTNFMCSKRYFAISLLTGTQMRRIINDAKNSYTHSLEHLVVNLKLSEEMAGYLHNYLVAKFRQLKRCYANIN